MQMKKLKPYPAWVCIKCAKKAMQEANITLPEGSLATFHTGTCGVCGKRTAVTKPRGYRWPPFKGFENL